MVGGVLPDRWPLPRLDNDGRRVLRTREPRLNPQRDEPVSGDLQGHAPVPDVEGLPGLDVHRPFEGSVWEEPVHVESGLLVVPGQVAHHQHRRVRLQVVRAHHVAAPHPYVWLRAPVGPVVNIVALEVAVDQRLELAAPAPDLGVMQRREGHHPPTAIRVRDQVRSEAPRPPAVAHRGLVQRQPVAGAVAGELLALVEAVAERERLDVDRAAVVSHHHRLAPRVEYPTDALEEVAGRDERRERLVIPRNCPLSAWPVRGVFAVPRVRGPVHVDSVEAAFLRQLRHAVQQQVAVRPARAADPARHILARLVGALVPHLPRRNQELVAVLREARRVLRQHHVEVHDERLALRMGTVRTPLDLGHLRQVGVALVVRPLLKPQAGVEQAILPQRRPLRRRW